VGEKQPHRLEDLDRAGGVWAVIHSFKSLVLPTPTITPKGALELARSAAIRDTHVIAAHRPIRKQSGIGVLRGNLAPRGAVFLHNQVTTDLMQVRGQAVVFDREIAAAEAISRGEVKKGSILIIRGQGPKGGPGLRRLRILPAVLESRGLNKFIPVITDGRLPDTPAGLFISFVSPEGATKGPLGILKNGDLIDIDIQNRTLGVRLTDTEMQIRYARWQAPESSAARGFLGRYSRLVSDANEGAVMK
jgi:dihydroxy-acid dehydratase